MKRGNKGKYTPELIHEVCKHIGGGLSRKDSAHLAGISEETLYTWLREKPDFVEAIKEAEVRWKKNRLGRIQLAGHRTWTANAWMLEQKFPEEFIRPSRMEISGKGGGPIPLNVNHFNFTNVTDDMLERFIETQSKNGDTAHLNGHK